MSIKKLATRRGDTLIEVVIAISVFCVVSIISIGIMDRDLNTVQGTLELEMARNEIDAQAEALRFIHNSFLSEREYRQENQIYRNLWKKLTNSIHVVDKGYAIAPDELSPFEAAQCSTYYDDGAKTKGEPHNIFSDNAFIINTRNVNPTSPDNTLIPASGSTKNKFVSTDLYPRIIYSASGTVENTDTDLDEIGKTYDVVSRVEGIWVIAVQDNTGNTITDRPEFFDFHIRTCWYPPNRDYPETIATIVRLYNPEVIK